MSAARQRSVGVVQVTARVSLSVTPATYTSRIRNKHNAAEFSVRGGDAFLGRGREA